MACFGPGGEVAAGGRGAFDPGDPPETPYRLAPSLTFGAELEVDLAFRRDLDLERRRDDDTALVTPELTVAWSFDPTDAFQVFLSVALSRDFVLAEGPGGAGADDDVVLEVKEAYGWLAHPAGVALQVGRQRFEDERAWLYDAELDAARLWYDSPVLTAAVSASRTALVRRDLLDPTSQEAIDNAIASLVYRPPIAGDRELEIEGYAILRNDSDAQRRRPIFVGLRSRGEPLQDLDYWLELGWVTGRDGGDHLAGWAAEVGLTYEVDVPLSPALTVGLAFGSGDADPDDGVDRSFRQTGLQDNSAAFGGAAEFKYYGEVLDPELSNLLIVTVGLGVKLDEQVSVDLVYHHYLQHHPAPELRGAALDVEPSGASRRLGSEVDLVLGAEDLWSRVDAKVVAGYFIPGAAFPDGSDGSWLVGAEIQFRF